MRMFWECPVIVPFWHAFFGEINLRLQINLTPAPAMALLGVPDDEQRTHHSKLLIAYLLFYAKKAIPLRQLSLVGKGW